MDITSTHSRTIPYFQDQVSSNDVAADKNVKNDAGVVITSHDIPEAEASVELHEIYEFAPSPQGVSDAEIENAINCYEQVTLRFVDPEGRSSDGEGTSGDGVNLEGRSDDGIFLFQRSGGGGDDEEGNGGDDGEGNSGDGGNKNVVLGKGGSTFSYLTPERSAALLAELGIEFSIRQQREQKEFARLERENRINLLEEAAATFKEEAKKTRAMAAVTLVLGLVSAAVSVGFATLSARALVKNPGGTGKTTADIDVPGSTASTARSSTPQSKTTATRFEADAPTTSKSNASRGNQPRTEQEIETATPPSKAKTDADEDLSVSKSTEIGPDDSVSQVGSKPPKDTDSDDLNLSSDVPKSVGPEAPASKNSNTASKAEDAATTKTDPDADAPPSKELADQETRNRNSQYYQMMGQAGSQLIGSISGATTQFIQADIKVIEGEREIQRAESTAAELNETEAQEFARRMQEHASTMMDYLKRHLEATLVIRIKA